MTTFTNIWNQIVNHIVAIISLAVAVTALGYTTWREEATEKNRNLREASFEVLKHLGELQIVINYGHYEPDNTMGNPILGWGHIAIIGDLGQILPPPIPEKTAKLTQVWTDNWQDIKTDEKAVDNISKEVDESRDAVLDEIRKLR